MFGSHKVSKVPIKAYTIDNLNDEQKKFFHVFKALVKKKLAEGTLKFDPNDDAFDENQEAELLRFLAAKEFKLQEAEKLMMEVLEWRAKFAGVGAVNLDPSE